MNNEIQLPNRCRKGHQGLKSPVFTDFFEPMKLFPLNPKPKAFGYFRFFQICFSAQYLRIKDLLQYSKYSSEKDSSPYFFILFRGGIESPAANARPQKTSGTTGHRTAESFIRQWSQGTGVMRHTSWRHSI